MKKSLISCIMFEQNNNLEIKKNSSLGGFEPPTFRLTAERASRLRHRDTYIQLTQSVILILK